MRQTRLCGLGLCGLALRLLPLAEGHEQFEHPVGIAAGLLQRLEVGEGGALLARWVGDSGRWGGCVFLLGVLVVLIGRLGRLGHGEGNRAEAAEETAKKASSLAVGDAGVVVCEEGEEDAVNLGRDFGLVEPGEAAADEGPLADAGK